MGSSNNSPLTHRYEMVKYSKTDNKNTVCNRNLYIKIYGNGLNQLATYNYLVHLLGCDLANKVVDKGLNAYVDKVVVKLRRGLKITLYCK